MQLRQWSWRPGPGSRREQFAVVIDVNSHTCKCPVSSFSTDGTKLRSGTTLEMVEVSEFTVVQLPTLSLSWNRSQVLWLSVPIGLSDVTSELATHSDISASWTFSESGTQLGYMRLIAFSSGFGEKWSYPFACICFLLQNFFIFCLSFCCIRHSQSHIEKFNVL
jgi:hypothetical protein